MSGTCSLLCISATVVPVSLAGLLRKQRQPCSTHQLHGGRLMVWCRVLFSSALMQFSLSPVPTTVYHPSGDFPRAMIYRKWGGRVEVSLVPAGAVSLSSPWRRVAFIFTEEPMSSLPHCLHVFQCPGIIFVFLGCSRGWDSRTWWLLLLNSCLQELGLRAEPW